MIKRLRGVCHKHPASLLKGRYLMTEINIEEIINDDFATSLTAPRELPPKSVYEARLCPNPHKPYKEYHDYLAQLVQDFGLLDLIDKPGAAMEKYTGTRRKMGDLSAIAAVAKVSTSKAIKIPEKYDWYPLPTLIYMNQGVGKDWLVERETGDVLVYALENTNVHPMNDPRCRNMSVDSLKEQMRQRTAEINFLEVSGAVGIGRLALEPGCAVTFPLCADPYLPRKAMPDNANKPATKLVAYNPKDPKHNRVLRGAQGVGTDVRGFIELEGEDG